MISAVIIDVFNINDLKLIKLFLTRETNLNRLASPNPLSGAVGQSTLIMAIRHRVLRIERLFLSWKFPAALAAALAVAVYRWITILKQRASRHKRYLQLLKQNSSFRAGPKDSQGVLAILGGGITGLAAAWHAKRLRPNLSVHLFEKDSDLGGNIKTKDFGDGVRIELGPRSLRTTTKSAKVALQV